MKSLTTAILGLMLSIFAGCQAETSAPWKPAAESEKGNPNKSPAKNATSSKSSNKTIVLQPKTITLDPNRPPWSPTGLAEFELTERSGRKITRKDLLGKPCVVCFIFTHCNGPCIDVSGRMKSLQDWVKLQKLDVRLVSISVDPKRDTPEMLRRYSKNFGADKDLWWFLTGKQEQIFKVVRSTFGQQVYRVPGAKPGFEVFHTTAVMLVDPKGKIVAEYNAKHPVSMVQLQQRLSLWKRTGSFAKPDRRKKKSGTESKASATKS